MLLNLTLSERRTAMTIVAEKSDGVKCDEFKEVIKIDEGRG